MIQKYRAYDTVTKEYITREFWIIGETTMFNVLEMQFEHNLERLNDIIVEQYIGKDDSEGKSICIGDRISCFDPFVDVFFEMEVVWDSDYLGVRFTWKDENGRRDNFDWEDLTRFTEGNFKVVGTIHDGEKDDYSN